jgi:hypothetical protein
MNRRIASALSVVAAVGSLVLATACGNDEGSAPAPEDDTTSAEPTKKEPKKKSERADLVSFRLDNRSQAGVTDIWVVWKIKNNSSEKSDYTWDWEAVDANGTRLENSTELATSVQPGQTAKGESPTTLESAKNVKLNITEFDRTSGS